MTEPEKSMTGEMHDGPVDHMEAPKSQACFTVGWASLSSVFMHTFKLHHVALYHENTWNASLRFLPFDSLGRGTMQKNEFKH
jgi:hypothetical protein